MVPPPPLQERHSLLGWGDRSKDRKQDEPVAERRAKLIGALLAVLGAGLIMVSGMLGDAPL